MTSASFLASTRRATGRPRLSTVSASLRAVAGAAKAKAAAARSGAACSCCPASAAEPGTASMLLCFGGVACCACCVACFVDDHLIACFVACCAACFVACFASYCAAASLMSQPPERQQPLSSSCHGTPGGDGGDGGVGGGCGLMLKPSI